MKITAKIKLSAGFLEPAITCEGVPAEPVLLQTCYVCQL